MFGQNNKKGTGFTNINRVLEANQGNKLGSSVASSVQNQAQQVKTQTQQSQQKFNEEAEKNRLDTDASKQKREDVIGRFGQQSGTTPTNTGIVPPQQNAVSGTNQVVQQVGQATTQNVNANANAQQAAADMEAKAKIGLAPEAPTSGTMSKPSQATPVVQDKFAPDMSKFALSSGLQDMYNQKKQVLTQQQTQQGAQSTQQKAAIQSQLAAQQAKLAQHEKALKDAAELRGSGSASARQRYSSIMSANYGQAKAAREAISSLQSLMGTFDQATNMSNTDLTSQLTNLEKEFTDKSKAEQDAYFQTERDKLIAANLPNEQEIAEFAKYRAGAYGGPQELQDLQSLMGQATDTEQLGDLTRSTGGRQELLRRFVGGEGYNQGQQKLDNLLLGQDESQGLNQARKATRGAEQNVNNANIVAKGIAQTHVNNAKKFGDETVGMLNNARKPVDEKINANLTKLQAEDKKRQDFLKSLQGTFDGSNEQVKGLDRIARLGLGLQGAKDAGYLTDDQAREMLGDNGLIARAEKMGLDTTSLINERMKDIASQNLNRGGAATSEQEAQISALDRLLGKQGTDVEFGQAGADYQKGNIGFDTSSLKDYITKSEAERAQRDPVFAQELENQKARYMEQSMAGGKQMVDGAFESSGDGALSLLNILNKPGNTGQIAGNAAGNMIEGAGNIAAGASTLATQGGASLMEGLAKLNIGGNSIANTEGGKQLLRLIDGYSEVSNQLSGGLTDITSGYGGFARELGRGNVTGAVGSVGNAVGNLVSRATGIGGAGKTGNWAAEELGTIDATTGKGATIGSFANRSSKDILKQLLSSHQIGSAYTNSKGNDSAKQTNKLIEYYNAALKREGKK